MQLTLSLISMGTKNFSLSKLKICNAVLLALLSNIVLLSSNDAYGYTVTRWVWPGTSTTYSKDTSLGTSYSAIVDLAASDWNNSSSPFDFNADNSSTNSIRRETISSDQYAATTSSFSGNNFTMFIMRINTNPPKPFYLGTGPFPSNSVDLRSLLRHEFGHALGLGHSLPTASLMYFSATSRGIFDMYTASTVRQQSLTWGGLAAGTHTLHVFVTGDKNIQSSNIYVDVDRLVVQ